MKRIFSNLWQGDIALWKTFWLFGVAVLTVIPQLIVISAGLVGGLWNIPDDMFLLLVSSLAIIYMAYGIFVAIAVQRSANKYQGPRILARTAKVTMAVLVTIIILLNVQGFFKEIKSAANQGPVRLP